MPQAEIIKAVVDHSMPEGERLRIVSREPVLLDLGDEPENKNAVSKSPNWLIPTVGTALGVLLLRKLLS